MNDRKVAVLTYPIKHRKTYDVISLLKANGYSDVVVFASPFKYAKKQYPTIQHRPELSYKIPEPDILCRNFGYEYFVRRPEEICVEKERIVLVAGAGILPDEIINSNIVLNSHPGYIPNCRGLDAFKWAINDNEPIGVTTHIIGKYIDAGYVIERRKIDVYPNDTFHSVAYRVYENEVSMLIEAIEKYDKNDFELILPGNSILHKRMPKAIEEHLLDRFEEYKNSHIG